MGLTLEEWGIIANIMMSVLTLGTVYLSYLNIKEMKKSREESSRPYIIVGYELDEKKFFNLYVKNIGLSPAKDIEVKIKYPIKMKDDEDIDVRDIIFKKPIKYLVPNQKIESVAFPIWDVPKENGEFAENYVEIEYWDTIGKEKYKEEYDIDIASQVNTLYFDNKNLTDLVKVLEKINKKIK